MNLFKEFDIAFIDQPYQTFVNLQNGAIDYTYFEQYKNKLVVINFSSEHWGEFPDYVYEQLEKTNINFLVLTYDYTKHQKHPRMFYFPYWYYKLKEETTAVDVTTIKNYSLGCLNGGARPHRIANFLKLRKKPYWNKTSITFYNTPPPDRHIELELTDDEINEWSEVRNSLPGLPFPNTTSKSTYMLDLPQLSDSYLHLVTETSIEPSVFTTEKTWKCIAAGIPFVMWGNPGTMNFLKNTGIDIYDDIVDHKYYDFEHDARLRLDKLYTVIDNLIAHGVDKIYNQLLDRMLDNRKKFFNNEFGQPQLLDIIDAINRYK